MPRAIGLGIGTAFGGSVMHPFAQLGATFAIDSSLAMAGEQSAKNFGSGGAALDARYGSGTGADSNDPLLLGWSGENYLYLPGVAGNYASTPDAAALDITGDIDIRVRVAMADWTPSGLTILVGKRASSSTYSYELRLNTAGTLALTTSPDGAVANAVTGTSTVATGITDGAVKWVRATLDVDDGAGNRVYEFFTSDDGSTWTQLGTTVTTAGTTSIFVGTQVLEVGSIQSGAAGFATGNFYRVQVLNGIGGTVVFDADFTTGITSGAQTTFTESSANAATVTINRSTTGRKAVAVVRPVWLLGTDDYFEVPDNDLLDFGASDDFTVVAVVRQFAAFGSQIILAKSTAISATMLGYVLYNNSSLQSSNRFGDGTNRQIPSDGMALTANALQVRAMVRDTVADNHLSYVSATAGATGTDTTTGTLANSEVMRIGRFSGGNTTYADMELLAVAVFRQALTSSEIAAIVNYYGAA